MMEIKSEPGNRCKFGVCSESMLEQKIEGIWTREGVRAGKTLTIIGGTHGNERTGTEVVLKLKAMIESGALTIERGTLNLILGNPRAIEINERGSQPFHDLNRSYSTDLLSREPDGTYEDSRAREIAPFLAKSDVVVDIHSTNKPSEPFLSCLHSSHHEEVNRWFLCDKILADPNFIMGGSSVTTDEYTEAHGGIGISYETGQASDTSRADDVMENILDLLSDLELIVHTSTMPTCLREMYELVEPIILTKDGFQFAQGFGDHSWEPFFPGQVIGYLGESSLIACYNGMLVFPKITKHWEEGKAVGYLAKRVSI